MKYEKMPLHIKKETEYFMNFKCFTRYYIMSQFIALLKMHLHFEYDNAI